MSRSNRTMKGHRVRRGLWTAGIVSAIIVALAALAGYFDREQVHVYPAIGPRRDIAAVNFSGDMGLRFLLGASTSRGLTQAGVPVVGISLPALFRRHRTRAEVDTIVANGIRVALARTGARRIVVMGQSFGADIVQAGLADLPAPLRARVAAIVLILPADGVDLRADPSGLAYLGRPDIVATDTANTLTWAPLTCIQGIEENDSLCPLLRVPGARRIAMPGGHNIHHDEKALLGHVLAAIGRVEAAR